MIGGTSYGGQFSGYDEYVPMVDKAVDSGWKKQPSPKPYDPKGEYMWQNGRLGPTFVRLYGFFLNMIKVEITSL